MLSPRKTIRRGARRRSGARYALSTTGIAGPDGGTAEKPVGTVFIALATAEKTIARHHVFQYDRETFKFVVSQTALEMLRREILSR